MSSSNRMTKSEQGISNQPFFLCICLGYWILLVGCWTRGQCLAIHSCFLWQKRQIEAPMASRIPRALPLCGANFRLPDLAGKCFGTLSNYGTGTVPAPSPARQAGLARVISKYFMGGTPMPLRMCQLIFRRTVPILCAMATSSDPPKNPMEPATSRTPLSLRTMSNSQPAVACGYGEAQQGISNIQGKYTETRPRGTVHPTQCQPQSNAICLALRTESRHCVWLNA